jgi:hypothetical protein
MKKILGLGLLVLLLAALSAPITLAQDLGEITVNCDDGLSFTNGIQFQVVQMRAGFDYTATAIGLNGFDPVLAVLGEDMSGICADDSREAADFGALLPSTGEVEPSSLSSQIVFNHSDRSGFQTISLVVGGYGDQRGEFILILEGMGITSGDNAGDPFSVRVTPAMVEAEVPIVVYALQSFRSSVDPILARIDGDFNVIEDRSGNPILCDDAGTSSCYTEGPELTEFGVSTTSGALPGGSLDANLMVDTGRLELTDDPDLNFINFLVSSYEGAEGQYVLVFHVGTSENSGGK